MRVRVFIFVMRACFRAFYSALPACSCVYLRDACVFV